MKAPIIIGEGAESRVFAPRYSKIFPTKVVKHSTIPPEELAYKIPNTARTKYIGTDKDGFYMYEQEWVKPIPKRREGTAI